VTVNAPDSGFPAAGPSSATPLAVLIVEDSADDAELVIRNLEKGGHAIEARRVETSADLLTALSEREWDVVLSDFSLPALNGLAAFEILRDSHPDVPFILVSGNIGEEAAAEAMRRGVADFVSKSSLARLWPVVERELRAREHRLEEARKQRSLERQILVAQRMEGLGRLAGGVAHDFNNLLTVIFGCTELIAEGLGSDHELAEHVAAVNQAAHRGSALVRQLLAFGRRQPMQRRVLEPRVMVEEFDVMLRRVIGADIRFVSDGNRAQGSIEADPSQLEQVLMNLVVNARDAMPSGGTLSISTHDVDIASGSDLLRLGLREEPYVCITVEDTGMGMDQETLSRIFEPFFSTKASDKGTGLGLSTVHGIVRQCGGAVLVDSELGAGTRFDIYLPRAVERAPVARSKAGEARASLGGGEHILVIEDEELIVAWTSKTLRRAGYEVMVAKGGHEAIEVARDAPQIDLVISDMVVPDMNGPAIVERIRERFPGVRVLFSSGYSDLTLPEGIARPEADVFLPKPYTRGELLGRVRAVLDAPEG
jgi:signal transduction histidine kinase